MADFDAKYRPRLEAALESGEELRGICAAGGAGGGWPTVEAAIADHSAVKLDLRLRDGEKLKLMMMHGKGVFGGLGGGESQRQGIAALAEWFGRLDAR